MELGVFSFGDVQRKDGKLGPTHESVTNLLEAIQLADKVGLDVFGIGEHHTEYFPASSPSTLISAAAATTKNIKLTSAVTVLSTDDPVRVYQQFATADIISDGRVEIIDEVGDIQELVEGDEIGEWESDEDPDEDVDEEDYEGGAADQEEAQLHGIHDVDGALGQLLRSLGGGGEGAAELMERIEAGELDGGEDEPMPGDYMEEGEDEGLFKS